MVRDYRATRQQCLNVTNSSPRTHLVVTNRLSAAIARVAATKHSCLAHTSIILVIKTFFCCSPNSAIPWLGEAIYLRKGQHECCQSAARSSGLRQNVSSTGSPAYYAYLPITGGFSTQKITLMPRYDVDCQPSKFTK